MIYAVIVTFNPEIMNLKKLVSELINSDVEVVIVDNGSIEPIEPSLGGQLISLGRNLGIASAQNKGIDFSIENGAKNIIFFDQDSSISDDLFINKLSQPLKSGKSFISAPVFIDEQKGFVYPIVEIKKNGSRVKHYPSVIEKNFLVNNVISSGTMVNVEVFKTVGKMAEELFIDYVDTEWCLRAHSKGFTITVVPSARMVHSIGDKSVKLGKFYVPIHNPIRRYYRIRNAFYLLRKSYIPKVMSLREILFSVVHQVVIVFVSPGKRIDYLKALGKGLKDGLLGRFN